MGARQREPLGHMSYLEGRSVGYLEPGYKLASRRNLTDEQPSPLHSTPNSHRQIDHSPTELIKRPTRSQPEIAPLESVPVFRSPCHTPHTTLASPPFPNRPGTSTPMDHRLEGLLMENNRRWTRKEQTKPSRRMSFLSTFCNDC